MALLSFSTVIYAISVYTLYSYIASFLKHRRLKRFARANGATFPFFAKSKVPWGIDVLWRVIRASKSGKDILEVYAETYTKNGSTFSTSGIFGPPELATIDPMNIQAILATKFQDFELGERRNNQFSAFLGKSIFTTDGPFWEHSRALFKPQFARDQINDLEKTEEAVQALFGALALGGDEKESIIKVDIMPMLFRFTLDAATDFLFGESVESQMAAAKGFTSKLTSAATAMAADQSDANMTFAEAFNEGAFWVLGRIRLQRLYWLAPSKKGQQATDYVRRYVSHYVQLALRSARDTGEKKEKKKKYSLLDALAQNTNNAEQLRDQILGILLAGRDTTATLLSWTLLLLAQHPSIFKKLRTRILDDFGPYSNDPSNINFVTLKACGYLQFVLRESLRLYNPVPLNTRVAVRDTTLPKGGGPDGQTPIVVPKGQTVNFSPYLLHRRKDIWSADAHEFNPDRWDGMKLDWNFIPFSGGPRICLGQQFALTEAGYLIVRLLQRFENMEWIGPHGEPRKQIHFTSAPKDGVRVKLTYVAS